MQQALDLGFCSYAQTDMNARYELSTEYLDDVGVAQVYAVYTVYENVYAWRIIPVSKSLITMVSKSPK